MSTEFETTDVSTPVSERRLAANRVNAQLSTGPRTEAGKAVSSLNAVKTGLCGRAVLLADERKLLPTASTSNASTPGGSRTT